MQIRMKPTGMIVKVAPGVEARLWEGITNRGVRCKVFVHRLAVREDEDQQPFLEELREMPQPVPATLEEALTRIPDWTPSSGWSGRRPTDDEWGQLGTLPPLTLSLSPLMALAILGHLQLALRHPRNTGPSTAMALDLARAIEAHVSAIPCFAEMCRRGWDPSFDAVRAGPAKAEADKCAQCDGCGRVADTADREPWTFYSKVPLESSAAVLLGLIKPIVCPVCNGSGQAATIKP